MTAIVTASERDLRTLAGIVSDDRGDTPAVGIPLSLLTDLSSLIPCDYLSFTGMDSARQTQWFGQVAPAEADDGDYDENDWFWQHYWDSPPLQLPRPHRRPAQRHQALGLLLGPAMAQR